MSEKSTDEVAIRTAAMDYAEGWFDGDVARMERALHPKLVKRAIERQTGSGEPVFVDLTKDDMLRFTRAGGGTKVPRDKLYYKVDILDICEEVADARVETVTYIDYLHLLNEGGNWLILNVIYTLNRAKQR
ncbi:MAG: nuclear transport factor 2 family protein [Chloroflexi bacterium]|nr:nuclear transport factor 2 family protein [Chloroflexota bacterium]